MILLEYRSKSKAKEEQIHAPLGGISLTNAFTRGKSYILQRVAE